MAPIWRVKLQLARDLGLWRRPSPIRSAIGSGRAPADHFLPGRQIVPAARISMNRLDQHNSVLIIHIMFHFRFARSSITQRRAKLSWRLKIDRQPAEIGQTERE